MRLFCRCGAWGFVAGLDADWGYKMDAPRLAKALEELLWMKTMEEKEAHFMKLYAQLLEEQSGGAVGAVSNPGNKLSNGPGGSSTRVTSSSSQEPCSTSSNGPTIYSSNNLPSRASNSSSTTATSSSYSKAPQSRSSSSEEPASKQLLDQLKPCAALAMRMLTAVATSSAALTKLQPQLQSGRQAACLSRWGAYSAVSWDTLTSGHEKQCMLEMLQVAKAEITTTAICPLLPQQQQAVFSAACRAVQQLSSTAGLTPEHMLPLFAPMAAVPVIWGSVCSNPWCMQLPGSGAASKKPKVRQKVYSG